VICDSMQIRTHLTALRTDSVTLRPQPYCQASPSFGMLCMDHERDLGKP
jgi:hypothetical protein